MSKIPRIVKLSENVDQEEEMRADNKQWCAMCGKWGSHTSGQCPQSFGKFFHDAEKSPIYWLEGVIIEIGEYLHGMQTQPFKNDKTKAKIRAAKKCLGIARCQMLEYEKTLEKLTGNQ